MNWENHKKEITAIIELIEDDKFPARRNITDYLCQMFGYPKEMEEFINSEYKRINPTLD